MIRVSEGWKRAAMVGSAVIWTISILTIMITGALNQNVFPERVDPVVLATLVVSTMAFASALAYMGIKKIWFES
ncbi:TPA: hypothetical protein HA344_01355 [Candidatus Bathyarchaeota archaeon]|jgi:uncharacterized membrane protein|nr:hypothetical protein [Candidatus Bathyarchaeota archaeon]